MAGKQASRASISRLLFMLALAGNIFLLYALGFGTFWNTRTGDALFLLIGLIPRQPIALAGVAVAAPAPVRKPAANDSTVSNRRSIPWSRNTITPSVSSDGSRKGMETRPTHNRPLETFRATSYVSPSDEGKRVHKSPPSVHADRNPEPAMRVR